MNSKEEKGDIHDQESKPGEFRVSGGSPPSSGLAEPTPIGNAKPAFPVLLSIPETARTLGASEAAVRKWLAQRRLPMVKLGRLTRLRFSDLEVVVTKGLPPAGTYPKRPRNHREESTRQL